jgi:hypothetical protein
VAQHPVGSPLGESDLADQLRVDPQRAAGVLSGDRGAERAVATAQRLQLVCQVGEGGLGEAGADVPGVPQPGSVPDAD